MASRDLSQAASGSDLSLSGPGANGDYHYGEWSIHYDPPPIPLRYFDWRFTHSNFDASWEGEEDGYVGNGLAGNAASLEACIAEINDIEADRARCPGCEETGFTPNVEAFETLDLLCCDDCAPGFLADHGQFGVGA